MTDLTFVGFTLTLLSEGGVTTPGSLAKNEPDAVVDRDVAGRYRIPGTSLAGLLRDRFERVHSPERARMVFGYVEDQRSKEQPSPTQQDQAVASSLWVFDALVDEPLPELVTRMTTAIDRHRGAAKNHLLREVQAFPAGTTFTGHLMWENATVEDIEDLAVCLRSWKIRLGRSVSTGAGSATIGSAFIGELDRSTDKDLTMWLTMSGPELVEAVAIRALDLSGPGADVERIVQVAFVVAGPVLVGGHREGNVLRLRRSQGKPVVPGSSVKGVVRSRMEYILRSVGVTECGMEAVPCGTCLPCTFFGHGGKADPDSASVGHRGRVVVESVTFTGQQSDPDPVVRRRTHVALDRFTGGSARVTRTDDVVHDDTDDGGRGKLYVVEAVERGAVTLTFDATELTIGEWLDFQALLRLVCDDLHEGYIGIGHGTMRGCGSIRYAAEPRSLGTRAEAQERLGQIRRREVAT